MRTAEIKRKTGETDIELKLNIDGTGRGKIDTGVGFLNHMLELFVKHGCFDLEVSCRGDTDVDFHHSAEDIGICLGKAFREAAGDCVGICRYGDIILPMDESLIMCAVDFGGRSYLSFDAQMPSQKVGDFDTELVEEFMQAFVRTAEINLHIIKLKGTNTHHIIEGIYKALARALRKALETDSRTKDSLPSTKGVL